MDAAREFLQQATAEHRNEINAIREQARADLAKAQERVDGLVAQMREQKKG